MTWRQQHATQRSHQLALGALVGSQPQLSGGPPVDQFVSLANYVQQGCAVHDGLALQCGARLGKHKAWSMVRALSEVVLHEQQDQLRQASSALIARDERRGRCHIRFRAVDKGLVVAAGFLGQTRWAGSSAVDIALATKTIVSNSDAWRHFLDVGSLIWVWR